MWRFTLLLLKLTVWGCITIARKQLKASSDVTRVRGAGSVGGDGTGWQCNITQLEIAIDCACSSRGRGRVQRRRGARGGGRGEGRTVHTPHYGIKSKRRSPPGSRQHKWLDRTLGIVAFDALNIITNDLWYTRREKRSLSCVTKDCTIERNFWYGVRACGVMWYLGFKGPFLYNCGIGIDRYTKH